MGNDGGSIPTRGDLVKTRKTRKADPSEKTEKNRTKWFSCNLTKETLRKHIVADQLGNLYNKEDVLRGLVEKSLPKQFKHIKSVKNLTDVQFQPNKNFDLKSQHQAGCEGDNFQSPFECPITQRPVNGVNPFSVLKTCGHAFSEKALIETETANPICYVCQHPYTQADILPLNPDKETQKKMKEELKQRKKVAKEKDAEEKTEASVLDKEPEMEEKKPEKGKKRKPTEDSEHPKKKQKVETNSGTSTPSLSVKLALMHAEHVHEKTKKSSQIYKSLFSSPDPTQPQRPASLTGIYFAKH